MESDRINLTEEELLFIKELENKLNVTEYSEVRRIVNKYVNVAQYNKNICARQEERIKYRDKELQELYEIKNKQVEQYDNLERKYQKALSEILELEYQLDKQKSKKIKED